MNKIIDECKEGKEVDADILPMPKGRGFLVKQLPKNFRF